MASWGRPGQMSAWGNGHKGETGTKLQIQYQGIPMPRILWKQKDINRADNHGGRKFGDQSWMPRK